MTKPSDYTEVDAMRDVDTALGKVDVDAQRRVLVWAASKFNIQPKEINQDIVPADTSSGEFATKSAKARSIKEFLAQKRPESSYEKIACLVYYMEKFDAKTEVDRKDIIQANADARLSKMSNPAVFIKHATHTYGYLISLGQRKFSISARGEAVVEALPDRTKVEEAHDHHSFGKKSKKRASKR